MNKSGTIKDLFLPGLKFNIILYGIVSIMTLMLISDSIFVRFGDIYDNETMKTMFK